MRRINPRAFPLVLFGGMLLLSLLGAVMGLASFLLLRAGYDALVWGLLPFLSLLLISLARCGLGCWAAGGTLPGAGRGRSLRGGSSDEGSRREDDV